MNDKEREEVLHDLARNGQIPVNAPVQEVPCPAQIEESKLLHKETDGNELRMCIEDDGFDYAMNTYSSWSDVKDRMFQEKLAKYKEARKILEDHINQRML